VHFYYSGRKRMLARCHPLAQRDALGQAGNFRRMPRLKRACALFIAHSRNRFARLCTWESGAPRGGAEELRQEVFHRRFDSAVSVAWDGAALVGKGEKLGLRRWGCIDVW